LGLGQRVCDSDSDNHYNDDDNHRCPDDNNYDDRPGDYNHDDRPDDDYFNYFVNHHPPWLIFSSC
jgi:hypothetical protein